MFYNDEDVPTYCSKFRLALDLVVAAVRSIAGVDAALLKGTTGSKIGTFVHILPERLYKDYGWQLLTDLNEVTKHYHHEDGDDESSDYPPREQWNADAQKCYELMKQIAEWLLFFKREMTDYLAHNKPDYKKILDDKKKALKEEPVSNTITNSEKPEFFEKCRITLDMEKQYREGLASDLVTAESDINDENRQNYDSLVNALNSSSQYKNTKPFAYVREIRELLLKLLASWHVYSYYSILHPILFRETWSPNEIADAPFSGANLSLEDIHYGLTHILRYASKNVVRKLSCHDLTKKNLQEVLDNRTSGAFKAFLGAVKNLSEDDLTILDNVGNIRRYLHQRDSRLLYMANKEVLAIENKSSLEFYNVVAIIADELRTTVLTLVSDLFSATVKDDWQSFYDFEKNYVTDILDYQEVKQLLGELKEKQAKEDAWNSMTERQKHIYELRAAIEDSLYIYIQKCAESAGDILSINEIRNTVEKARESGLLNQQDPDYFIKACLFCTLLFSLRQDGADDVLDQIIDAAKDAKQKGLLDINDPDYLQKAIAIAGLIVSKESKDYSREDVEEAIAEFKQVSPFNDIPKEARLAQLCFGLLFPLFKAIDYVVRNYPLGLYRYLKEDVEKHPFALGNSSFNELKYLWAPAEEVFAFIQSMTPFGQQRLISDMGCPAWRRSELISSIQKADFESFLEICKSEKLTLIDDLSEIVGYIRETIEKPMNRLFISIFGQDLSEEEATMMIDNANAQLGLPDKTLDNIASVISSDKGLLKLFFPIGSDEELENYSSTVISLVGLYSFFDLFKPDEANEINKILDNPNYTAIVQLSQYYYYYFFGTWPKNTKILLSQEWQEKIIRECSTPELAEAPVLDSSNRAVEVSGYQYSLPGDLFEGNKVDIIYGYIPGLKDALKSEEVFGPLFAFILRIGGVSTDEEASALLRAFTGYPVENANQKAKWEADYHILYYLVKYMFTPKKSYVSMFQCIDIYFPSDDERQKAEKSPSSYAERISGDDASYIIETLSRLSSVFPRPETPITD